jgi:D-sedoheptulose 7-phosphate isomerase
MNSVEEYLVESIAAMNKILSFKAEIEKVAIEIWNRLELGGTVYWMGNGGSAGDSQHLATELVAKFAEKRRPLRSHALTTNSSLLTALGNDDGYETIFSRQVEAFVSDRDVVIGISTSGMSPSVLKALKIASELDAFVIGMTGRGKNLMDTYCNHIFHAPSDITGVIQQMHITYGQALCLCLEQMIRS